MEFRCRLGTAGGDVIEGVYVAESEARLRRDFEDKGLYVLGDPAGGAGGVRIVPAAEAVAGSLPREFLVFNQELATLLKAGMPLVQSLDILRQRVANPLLKTVLDDIYDRVRAGSSLSEAFEAHGTLFPGIYTASLLAGEKSGSLEAVIRRYVAYVKVVSGVRRKTISALVYPAILLLLSCVVVAHHRPEGGPGVRSVLQPVREGVAALDPHHRRDFAVCRDLLPADGRSASSQRWRPSGRGCGRPATGAGSTSGRSGFRCSAPIAQKFATSQAARTLATLLGGGIPLVNAIDVAARSIGNQYMAHELQAAAQQVREGRALATAMIRQRRLSGCGDQDGRGRRVDRRAAGDAQQPLRFLRRRDRDEPQPLRHASSSRRCSSSWGSSSPALLLSLYMPLFNLSSAIA